MEKKIVYFKLMQIVLTLEFIWQIVSLHQFCGTFADPKAFIHDNISLGHCKGFTLIGKDSKSGEFGVVFDQDKWYNQLTMSSTNGRPIEEQQHHQFMDELAAKLPPAGRLCIPIMISPFYWIRLYKNQLNNGTLFYFSLSFWHALWLLSVIGFGIMAMRSVEENKFWAYYFAFYSVFFWCICAWHSSNLLLNWTDFWTCVNFRADHTNVPLVTLVISIVMVCSSVFEIVIIHQQQKKNGSAVII